MKDFELLVRCEAGKPTVSVNAIAHDKDELAYVIFALTQMETILPSRVTDEEKQRRELLLSEYGPVQ